MAMNSPYHKVLLMLSDNLQTFENLNPMSIPSHGTGLQLKATTIPEMYNSTNSSLSICCSRDVHKGQRANFPNH